MTTPLAMVYSAQVTLCELTRKFGNEWLPRREVQVCLLLTILVLSFGLLWYGRSRLDPEEFLVHGYLGVFLVNIITAATILFPLPGEAANIAAGSVMNPFTVTVVATTGATIGEMTSYLAGYYGRALLPSRYESHYAMAKRWMARYGLVAVFLFSLVPMLVYDLIGMVAGSTRYHLPKFVTATFAGRFLRYLVYTYAGYSLSHLLPFS